MRVGEEGDRRHGTRLFGFSERQPRPDFGAIGGPNEFQQCKERVIKNILLAVVEWSLARCMVFQMASFSVAGRWLCVCEAKAGFKIGWEAPLLECFLTCDNIFYCRGPWWHTHQATRKSHPRPPGLPSKAELDPHRRLNSTTGTR